MVGVQYMWEDAATCLSVIRDWQELDLFFPKTSIRSDNLEEYAKLVAVAPKRIAAGEWSATRHEFQQPMEAGGVQVAQPDVGRIGGLGEVKIVCDMAAERGQTIVPHCWKTGISISATAHLAFVTGHCAFIEYLPPQLCVERLRRELVQERFDACGRPNPHTDPARPGGDCRHERAQTIHRRMRF